MHDTIVIGAGIFGSVIAARLRQLGQDVLVIDAEKPGSGSKPAACLMKPSWLGSMSKEQMGQSFTLLDELYGLQEVTFALPVGSAKVPWVPPASILQPANLAATVERIERRSSHWTVEIVTGFGGTTTELIARRVVVAAGIWTNDVLQRVPQGSFLLPEIAAQTGVSFLWKKAQIQQPFIRPWAPYKQIVAFNRAPDEVWAGDGTSILRKNWSDKRVMQSGARVNLAVPLPDKRMLQHNYIVGHRPYVKGAKPCYLEEPLPGLWVATGGAKNGTAAAGWCAHVIGEQLS